MRLMLMSMMIVLGISCNSFKPTKIMHLNLKLNSCFVYCFQPDQMSVIEDIHCGIDFVSGEMPIEACDKVVGFDVDYYTEYFRGTVRERIQYCNDLVNFP